MKKGIKDVDINSDCGRKNDHKDLSHPPRKDLEKRYNEKTIPIDEKSNYKDTVFDPDLKSGSKVQQSKRISERLRYIARKLAKNHSEEDNEQ